ncbi:MAG: glycosyltransferase [Gemmatimonadota bacterium]|jgi:trehalose synthase
MRRVELASKSIEEYRGLIGHEAVSEIEKLAAPLRGARVLHLNATAHGGGVAELLPTLVGLKRGLGIEAEWHALSGNDAFFEVTKKLHNGLQGMDIEFSPDLRGLYLSTLEQNREAFKEDWDFVVVHDPQPAGLVGLLDGRRTGHWMWRCHVDTSTPGGAAIDFLAPYMGGFELAIFTLPDYATPRLSPKRTEFVYPSIDPLAPKNQALSPAEARQILAKRFEIDAKRPLMTQVSRYDPWKDPLGVIDVYRTVKQRVKDVQLALVGNLADDDPEGIEYHARAVQHAGDDPDIHVLSTLDRLSQDDLTHALEVNAFQTGSDVVVQKSTREGFGLVVTEAMWKCSPVVGGRVGGIVHQIEDGVTGYLVSDADECADRVAKLLKDPDRRREMGKKARESVRQRFLTPRHLADYLRIFQSL